MLCLDVAHSRKCTDYEHEEDNCLVSRDREAKRLPHITLQVCDCRWLHRIQLTCFAPIRDFHNLFISISDSIEQTFYPKSRWTQKCKRPQHKNLNKLQPFPIRLCIETNLELIDIVEETFLTMLMCADQRVLGTILDAFVVCLSHVPMFESVFFLYSMSMWFSFHFMEIPSR